MSIKTSVYEIGKYDKAKSAWLMEIHNRSWNKGSAVAESKSIITPSEAAELYCLSCSSAHNGDPSQLLHLSDIMADDLLKRYDLYAAEARLEYLLKVDDQQFSDHELIASDLLDFEQDDFVYKSIYEKYRIVLLKKCLPLYNLVRNKPSSQNTIHTVCQELRQLILWLTEAIDQNNCPETKATLAGYANEVSILLILMTSQNINESIVIPAFSHQDLFKESHYSSESQDYGSKSRAFDIVIYKKGTSELTDKIQVKTSKNQLSGTNEYQDDITVIYAREIAEQYLKDNPFSISQPELYRILGFNQSNELTKKLFSYIDWQQQDNQIYIPSPRINFAEYLHHL